MNILDRLEKRRQKNPQKIELDKLTMKTALVFLTTSRGWIVRQAIKMTAYVTTPLTVWLEANGQGDHVSAIVTGIVAGVTVLVELGLSWLARKNP